MCAGSHNGNSLDFITMQPILKVNLTTGDTEEYRIPGAWEKDFLGGASLAARLLYDALTPELDALIARSASALYERSDNGHCRSDSRTLRHLRERGLLPVYGLNPIGWILGTGTALRRISMACGSREEPRNRSICGSTRAAFEVRNAAHLWGKDTYETQTLVKEEIGRNKARVAAIGEAGERGVLYAGIFCDHGRTAGRTGLGAVMGAKNLKAVAVYGKKAALPLVHSEVYAGVRSASNRTLRQDNQTQVMHELGTASAANYSEYLGAMPGRYYHQGSFEEVDNVSGAKMSESILSGTSACHACVIACGRVVTSGRWRAPQRSGIRDHCFFWAKPAGGRPGCHHAPGRIMRPLRHGHHQHGQYHRPGVLFV